MDIIQEARKLAVREIEQYGLPHIMHFEISENITIKLAKEFQADPMVVQVGIALMDLKLGQAFKEGRSQDHVQMSVDAVRVFLDRFDDLDTSKKEKIINCVEAHHKDVPFTCIEAEICANADCYRFLHPKGIFTYFALLGQRLQDIAKILDTVEYKMDEKYAILSLDVCKQELIPYYENFKEYINKSRDLLVASKDV